MIFRNIYFLFYFLKFLLLSNDVFLFIFIHFSLNLFLLVISFLFCSHIVGETSSQHKNHEWTPYYGYKLTCRNTFIIPFFMYSWWFTTTAQYTWIALLEVYLINMTRPIILPIITPHLHIPLIFNFSVEGHRDILEITKPFGCFILYY